MEFRLSRKVEKFHILVVLDKAKTLVPSVLSMGGGVKPLCRAGFGCLDDQEIKKVDEPCHPELFTLYLPVYSYCSKLKAFTPQGLANDYFHAQLVRFRNKFPMTKKGGCKNYPRQTSSFNTILEGRLKNHLRQASRPNISMEGGCKSHPRQTSRPNISMEVRCKNHPHQTSRPNTSMEGGLKKW